MTETALTRQPFAEVAVQPVPTTGDLTDQIIPKLQRAMDLRRVAASDIAAFIGSIGGRPVHDNILVLPLPPDEHYGNIIIPEDAKEDQECGIVVAVGRGHYQNGTLIPVEIVPGNYVEFSKYAVRKVVINGNDLYHLSEADVTFIAGN